MSFRTVFLIITLAFVSILLILIAVENDRRVEEKLQAVKTTPLVEKKTDKNSELFFVPSNIEFDNKTSLNGKNNQVSSDIFLNSHEEEVSAVQTELFFDNNVIDKIWISNAQNMFFFGNENEYKILFNNTDYANGRVSFTVASLEKSLPKKGIGKVATLFFTVKQNAKTKNGESQIIFLDKTMVSSPYTKESILKNHSPLIINIKNTINQPSNSTSSAQIGIQ